MVDPRVTPPAQGGEAVYKVDYTIEMAGDYSLVIKLGSSDIQIDHGRDIIFVVIPGDAFTETTTVDDQVDIAQLEDDVPAGTDAKFTVTSYDRYQNLRKDGGDALVSELRALSGDSVTSALIIVPCEVTDLHTGNYFVQFSATRSGTYSVLVTLNGENLRETPFDAIVVAAERSPAKCVAEGAGLVGGQHAKDLTLQVISKGAQNSQMERSHCRLMRPHLCSLGHSSMLCASHLLQHRFCQFVSQVWKYLLD